MSYFVILIRKSLCFFAQLEKFFTFLYACNIDYRSWTNNMEKIDSYARHFLILIALILGLSLVSEFRDLANYAPSMIDLVCLSIATACTFASGITLQFKKLNLVTIILAGILISVSVFFWIEFSSLALIIVIFIIYGIITLLVCLTNLIYFKKREVD